MSFLDAEMAVPKPAPALERFVRAGWARVEVIAEAGVSTPADLATLYGLRWLGSSGHLGAVRRARVDAVLGRVGAELLDLDATKGLILCSLAAPVLDEDLVGPLQAALRRREIGPSSVQALEVRLLARYSACRPIWERREVEEGPPEDAPPILPLREARERVVAIPGGVPRTVAELASVLYLGGLFLSGQTKDEQDEGAAVRLVHLGLADLAFSSERLAMLLRWIEGKDEPEMGARLEALWARVEADRVEWTARAAEVEARLRPHWREGLALAPHQLEGVARIERFGFRALLSDDMGLGKGPMALGAVTLCPKPWPLCILAPVSMQGGWRYEISRWLDPDVEVITLDRPSSIESLDLRPGQRRVLLGNWSFPSLHAEAIRKGLLRAVRGVIGDESQALGSVDSVRTRAFWDLRRPANLRLLLTGTATQNGRMIELWPQLHAIEPDRIVPLAKWKREFCGDEVIRISQGKGKPARAVRTYKGRSKLVDLAKIRSTIEIRRTKAELGASAGLPDKVRRVFPITLSIADHVRLLEVKEEVRVSLEARVLEVAAEMAREKKGAEAIARRSTAILRSAAMAALGKMAMETGRLKIPYVLPLLADVLAEGHRPLVFGVNLAVLREAATQFESLCKKGEVRSGVDLQTPEARTALVNSWESGRGRILVLSGKYNAGVTLVSSACTLMLQRFFVPGIEQQIEDRTHRRGQIRTCEYWYPHAVGTTDEMAAKLLTWKERGVASSQGTLAVRVLNYLYGEAAPASGLLQDTIGQLREGVDGLEDEGELGEADLG